MTEKEAIKGLNNLFSEHELTLPCTDSLEILHMAVAALEKQMPKKPKDNPLGSLYCQCPNCSNSLLFEENDFSKCNYCAECGQAIDWSDNDH